MAPPGSWATSVGFLACVVPRQGYYCGVASGCLHNSSQLVMPTGFGSTRCQPSVTPSRDDGFGPALPLRGCLAGSWPDNGLPAALISRQGKMPAVGQLPNQRSSNCTDRDRRGDCRARREPMQPSADRATASSDDARTLNDALLPAPTAATRLGISVTTLYDWLGQSDRGVLVIRGQRATIEYFQGGPRGQGRIQIEAVELDRLRELMRVHPQRAIPRQLPVRRDHFPGIKVPLGRPGR